MAAAKPGTSSSTQASDNRIFLFRLQMLIIDGGLAVLRNYVDQELSAQSITLSGCLANEKTTIKLLKGRGIITQVQYDLLYPTSGTVSTLDLDITLIICLMRSLKCFKLNKQFNWNISPGQSNTSIEADICRLKNYRNEICRISTTTGIQYHDFSTKWKEIEQILLRIDKVYPIKDFKQTITDFEYSPLDPKTEQRVKDEIEKWEKHDKAIEADKELLKAGHKKTNEDLNTVKTKIDEIEGRLSAQNTSSNMQDERRHENRSEGNIFEMGFEWISYRQMKTEFWARCIERKSESAANILLEREIYPCKDDLIYACHVFGRNSKIISHICSMISQHVKKQFMNVIDVFPTYKENYKCSIIFLVIVKKKSTFSVFKDYEYCIRCENDVSTEGDLVAKYETNDETMSQFDNETFEKLRKCVNDNANDLLERHSNINVILPSFVKSVGYETGQHNIKQVPCIALYVTVKGCIPLNEKPFQKNINGFQTDVLEGKFEPFMNGPNEYHENLKIGIAIHANVLNTFGVLGGTLGGFIDHSVHGLCGITCAHVVYSPAELMEIKDNKQCCLRKKVYQPIGKRSSAFGEVVQAFHDIGGSCTSGMEVVLISIQKRQPKSGSFPETFTDFEAGFDARNPLCFNSGAVCETSEIKRRSEVYKFGMISGITRGSFALQGAVVRKSQMQGDCHGFGFNLMNQLLVLQIGEKPFAENGDSGALVLTEGGQDSIAIGIVAGGMNSRRVFVTPICDILRAFGCTESKMHRFTPDDYGEDMEI